jgi:hypothetical protein
MCASKMLNARAQLEAQPVIPSFPMHFSIAWLHTQAGPSQINSDGMDMGDTEIENNGFHHTNNSIPHLFFPIGISDGNVFTQYVVSSLLNHGFGSYGLTYIFSAQWHLFLRVSNGVRTSSRFLLGAEGCGRRSLL